MIARMKTLGIDQWEASEKLALLEEIWDSLTPQQIPLTATQQAEIDRRIEDIDRNPAAEVSWDEAKANALARLRK